MHSTWRQREDAAGNGSGAAPSAQDDIALVRRARQGDADAVAFLFERCYHNVAQLAYYMLRDRDDADDATQDTFRKALERLDRYRATGPFKSWLLSICRNVCIDQLRRAPCVPTAVIAPDGADHEISDPAAEDVVGRVALRLAMATLPREELEAWLLLDVLGLTSGAAAAMVGVRASSTLRSRAARARVKLKRSLDDDCGPFPAWTPVRDLCALDDLPRPTTLAACAVPVAMMFLGS